MSDRWAGTWRAEETARRRLQHQRLVGEPFDAPADVVRWFGAVQSQDYLGAKWALALRLAGVDSAGLDRAFDAGAIIRTHVLRPTWHFVAPEDIRWLVALTGPRVLASMTSRLRQLELDEATLRRSDAVLVEALQGGRALTRHELGAVFDAARISPAGQRLPYLLSHGELVGLVCSGPLRGRQQTYALIDERVPAVPPRARDEAVAELARRYFASHGPATLNDWAWWSGLTVADGRRGLETIKGNVERTEVDGKTYWTADPGRAVRTLRAPIVHLLPNYDEILVAYRDHGPSMDPAVRPNVRELTTGAYGFHSIAVDGLVVGAWRRSVSKTGAVVQANVLRALSDAERAGLAASGERFSRFLGLPVVFDESA
jgi:hypothetical protein